MGPMRIYKVVEKDGEIVVTGLPCKKGDRLEVILLPEAPTARNRPPITARRLLHSGLIGLWKDRNDIGDSAGYARQLREQAQRR